MDRAENIRRVGEVAKLFFEAGHIVLCTFISPFAKGPGIRAFSFPGGSLLGNTREMRFGSMQKKRSKRAVSGRYSHGEIQEFTGISSPYEPPYQPDLTVETDRQSVEDILQVLMGKLQNEGIIAHNSHYLVTEKG